jgi:hypothetical protein
VFSSHHQPATIARALSTTAACKDSKETTNNDKTKSGVYTSLNDLADNLPKESGAEAEAAAHRAVEEENAGVTSMDALLKSVRK